MSKQLNKIEIYLESGQKRVFAGALDWPGWCRSGRDEESALHGLVGHAPRYAKVIQDSGLDLDFKVPSGPEELVVVERLEGGGGTDFGAPEVAPATDEEALDENDLSRQQAILMACWAAFDRGVRAAQGRELRKGPRGGGRELEKIVEHVQGAEASYLGALGVRFKPEPGAGLEERLSQARQAILNGLATAAQGELPKFGPRGRHYWTPRYFVRRAAWHVLDHLWEIEDRVL